MNLRPQNTEHIIVPSVHQEKFYSSIKVDTIGGNGGVNVFGNHDINTHKRSRRTLLNSEFYYYSNKFNYYNENSYFANWKRNIRNAVVAKDSTRPSSLIYKKAKKKKKIKIAPSSVQSKAKTKQSKVESSIKLEKPIRENLYQERRRTKLSHNEAEVMGIECEYEKQRQQKIQQNRLLALQMGLVSTSSIVEEVRINKKLQKAKAKIEVSKAEPSRKSQRIQNILNGEKASSDITNNLALDHNRLDINFLSISNIFKEIDTTIPRVTCHQCRLVINRIPFM